MPQSNPNNPAHLARLRAAIDYSYRKLQPFRQHRFEAIREYVGARYSSTGASQKVPVNLIELAVNIYVRHLAARRPAAMFSSDYEELRSGAVSLEIVANRLIKAIKYEKSMQSIVLDAMFGMGIAMLGLNLDGEWNGGILHDPKQIFLDKVDLDDWVHDIQATIYEQVQFAGNKFRVQLDYVKENKDYVKSVREKLVSETDTATNDGGDYRVAILSRGEDGYSERFKDMVELINVWLPYDRLIVTLPYENLGSKPLRIVEWDGPEAGPYHILSFSEVPGNIMPLPPVALWMEIHDSVNRLYRKNIRKAERQKTLLLAHGPSAEDPTRIGQSDDGDIIRIDNAGQTKEFSTGGIDGNTLAFSIHLKDMFTYLAGNLDSLGGLSPQSKTVGQDKLLGTAASIRTSDMQDRVVAFNRAIMTDIGLYLFRDQSEPIPIERRIEELGITVQAKFSPRELQGEFYHYNFDVQPYSMQEESPASKLETLVGVFNGFILPLQQQIEAQGGTVDFEKLLRYIAKYTNMSEFEEMLKFSRTKVDNSIRRSSPVLPGKPVNTTHTSTKVNIPGSSRSSQDSVLINALLGSGTGGNPQTSKLT